MKRLKKIGVLLFAICLMAVSAPNEAFAASAKVSVSSVSGTVGSSVKVTCTATMSGADIGGADVTLEYDPSALSVSSCSSGASGGSGSVYYSQAATNAGASSLSFTVTFKILKEGSHGVKVSYADVYDWETAGSVGTSTSGGTVTGKAESSSNNKPSSGSDGSENHPQQDTRDKNNNLKSLEVYPGSLAPAFSSGTTSYTVTVPGETMEVTITATAASTKAKVSVSGGKDLKLGENAAKVVVTAENGSTKVYNITIVCGEVEKIDIGGTEHTINEAFKDEQVPAGFTRTKLTYNGREYEGLTNESGTLQLMSLQNGEVANFYIYNKETQEFNTFAQVEIAAGKYIYLMPLNETNEKFADCEKTTVIVGEKAIDAWKLDDEFSVVTAWDQNGQEVLYRYDSVDGTFQRYVEIEEVVDEVVEAPVEKWPNIPIDYLWYAVIGLGALSMILLISLIYFIATRKSRHAARKVRAQKKAEKAAAKAAAKAARKEE